MEDRTLEQESVYMTIDTFNETLLEYSESNVLSLMHINCRSLGKNFDNITLFLNSVHIDFSIIGLTETWLNNESQLYHLPKYQFVGIGRENKRGGGVGFYISDTL